ncbi:hypothetical protein M422DRAFT_245223 [Sphaerobolus stellatus SS14]|nr:hypothetical protein M422DRAFT_245223 [Sphaerobolus stellatus SS14]
MSLPYHVFDAQDSFRFNATRDIAGSLPTPMFGSQAEHLASLLHYLHGHPLVPYSPDPCYAYYGHSVTIPTNRIEPTMEPITTRENHDDGSLHWDPSASLQAFASDGDVAIPKHVEPYNASLSSVQSDHGELGDANCTGGLSNLSETTSMSSDSSNTTTDPRVNQTGPSSSPTTVNNFITSSSSTPQEHVLPNILPRNKDPEAYIATFGEKGLTASWERDEIHKHVKAHLIEKTHECLCDSTFPNFQAAQKHCRNAKSTGNICPIW